MKVILTENQINNLILLEEFNNYLNSQIISEGFNYKSLRKIIKRMLLSGMTIAAILTAINGVIESNERKMEILRIAEEEMQAIKKQQELEKQSDSIKNAKIQACADYMSKVLGYKGYKLTDTKLTPEALVETSEKYSFDLPLLLAAAHLESCFGVTKRAKKTNSVYSVGAYDNGKDVVSYSHPNESIEGYIRLLQQDYLINGKTINDLLKTNGFVNKNGYRYASDNKYEQHLNSIRNKIIQNYPELK